MMLVESSEEEVAVTEAVRMAGRMGEVLRRAQILQEQDLLVEGKIIRKQQLANQLSAAHMSSCCWMWRRSVRIALVTAWSEV